VSVPVFETFFTEQKGMSEHGQNSIDKTVLARWAGEILAIHSKLDDQKMENLRICKEIREPLADLYDAAKNAGLPSKAFKAYVKSELAKRAYEKRLANLEPEDEDDSAIYELMREIAQNGDLFDAAVKAHDAKKGDDDADLRPGFLKDKGVTATVKFGDGPEVSFDAARVTENIRRLKTGIKPIGLPGADANEA
jgi:hypothetical protein